MAKTLATAFCAAALAATTPFAAPLRAQATEEAVLATVRAFFDAEVARDAAASRAVLLADGQYFTVAGTHDVPVLNRVTNPAHFAGLETSSAVLVARWWDATVLVRGTIALVWTPYDSQQHGEFLHCGVAAFSLVRTNDGWRIASILFTMQPERCEPVPVTPVGSPAPPLRLVPAAQREATGTVRDAVLGAVHGFSRALSAKDVAASRAVLLAEGQGYATRIVADGSVQIDRETNEQYFEWLATTTDKVHERMWDETVLVHGPIAFVWALYDYHENGAFSHCGVNALSLVRTDEGWKSADWVWTIEPGGCGVPAEPPFEPYLGQPLPGLTPVRFAPGIVSTDAVELNSVFSPDGREFFFTRLIEGDDEWGYPGRLRPVLHHVVFENGAWSAPRPLLLFPGGALSEAVDMSISPDGQELFFMGQHPHEHAPVNPPYDLWVSRRRDDGTWSTAAPLPPPVRTEANEIYSSVVADGSLYFNSNRPGGLAADGRYDLYRAQRLPDGSFAEPVNVGAPVNSEWGVGDTFVAPDESYMIFASRRPGGLGQGDLFVSFRQADGGWGEPINLGPDINSEDIDYCPMVSPDGRFLFFSRRQGAWEEVTGGDIFWVDTEVIQRLRPQTPGRTSVSVHMY